MQIYLYQNNQQEGPFTLPRISARLVSGDLDSATLAWHEGMDFAGAKGSEVIAVANGVVVFAGYRDGYGQMVEISHGKDLRTRYGHHEEVLVHVGQSVKRGDVIALMGSSGRSTGPHVHFEVLKEGRPVNPARYVSAVAQ